MKPDRRAVSELANSFDDVLKERLDTAATKIVNAKERGEKVVVATGSGPNLHEGATTLIAELMRVGIVDGVLTSSATVAHEMAGVLDRVKHVESGDVGLDVSKLPRDGGIEFTLLSDQWWSKLRAEMVLDETFVEKLESAEGWTTIKAAGNMSYPMGWRTEKLASDIEQLASEMGVLFEHVAGLGADSRTMIGQGALLGVPVLVTVPQLIGGGQVGLSISDSTPLSRRSRLIADLLGDAEVIIESGLALAQEIHDGPFETYTGHGIWAQWDGRRVYRLEGKTLIRMDLDPSLERAWQLECTDAKVQEAASKSLPKAKMFDIPFRMEMSGFARLEGSLPLIGDLGRLWPVLALDVSQRLGVELEFMSYAQDSPNGAAMREWIVETIEPVDRDRMFTLAATIRS